MPSGTTRSMSDSILSIGENKRMGKGIVDRSVGPNIADSAMQRNIEGRMMKLIPDRSFVMSMMQDMVFRATIISSWRKIFPTAEATQKNINDEMVMKIPFLYFFRRALLPSA